MFMGRVVVVKTLQSLESTKIEAKPQRMRGTQLGNLAKRNGVAKRSTAASTAKCVSGGRRDDYMHGEGSILECP